MLKIKKIPYIEYLPIIILSILSYIMIMNYGVITGAVGIVFKILTPFVWGLGIAFILNPLVGKFEKHLKFSRLISVILTYLILIIVIAVIFTQLIPQVVQNINQFINDAPKYSDSIVKNVKTYADMFINYMSLDENTAKMVSSIKSSDIDKALEGIGGIGKVLGGLIGGVIGFATGVVNIFIGIIISIYVLIDKKKFKKSIKRALYAVVRTDVADATLNIFREARMLFTKYLIGQASDSVIVGIIAVIGFSILGTPYAFVMGMMLGVMNMIPYFGPIMGAIPIVTVTLFTDPMLALYTLIFILVLQQIDGNVLSPNIVGGSLGVTPFWSIMAILIGGSLFGIVGMILCVPGFALIRNMFVRWVNRRIEIKMSNDENLPESL